MARVNPRSVVHPGDIVLLQIKGVVGKLVWAMQAINGDFSKWTHVGIMLEDGTIFEAQPGGAVLTDWGVYRDRPYTTVIYRQVGEGREDLVYSRAEEMKIIQHARNLVGAGYNWTTYFYLAGYRMGIRPAWLKKRVRKSTRHICSQAADHIYQLAGVQLFDDGRMPYDITPGDLARLT